MFLFLREHCSKDVLFSANILELSVERRSNFSPQTVPWLPLLCSLILRNGKTCQTEPLRCVNIHYSSCDGQPDHCPAAAFLLRFLFLVFLSTDLLANKVKWKCLPGCIFALTWIASKLWPLQEKRDKTLSDIACHCYVWSLMIHSLYNSEAVTSMLN